MLGLLDIRAFVIYITIVLIFAVAFIIVYIIKTRGKDVVVEVDDLTLENLIAGFDELLIELGSGNKAIQGAKTPEEVDRFKKQAYNITQATKISFTGEETSRNFLKSLAIPYVDSRLTPETVATIADFENEQTLDGNIMWEAICFRVSQEHGKEVLDALHKEYNLTEIVPKHYYARNSRVITREKLERIYLDKCVDLSYPEQLAIIAQVVYSYAKGNGIMDTLYSLKVDGLELGTSGSNDFAKMGRFNEPFTFLQSIWFQINGDWTHFYPLQFSSIGEMRRITINLTTDTRQLPLSNLHPKKVVEGWDGARITGTLDPLTPVPNLYIRKGYNKPISLWTLLSGSGKLKNIGLPYIMSVAMMRGGAPLVCTGGQNTGKTTILKALIGLKALVNIRSLEMTNEVDGNNTYPHRNYSTFVPTETVGPEEIQAVLKKTDAWSLLAGEIAENIVAANWAEFGLTGSGDVLASYHGFQEYGLVTGLGNALVASGKYTTLESALDVILGVLKINIHCQFVRVPGSKTGEKVRAPIYISQLIRVDSITEYPKIPTGDVSELDLMAYANILSREYYTRTTDRVKFTYRRLVELNQTTLTYEVGRAMTPDMLSRLLGNMSEEEDRVALSQYIATYHGNGTKTYFEELDAYIRELQIQETERERFFKYGGDVGGAYE